MFVVIETGGKQYKLKEKDKVIVEKLPFEEGSEIELDKVLMLVADEIEVGNPYLNDVKVIAKVLRHGRGPKIVGMKFKRRKNYKRKYGHRQEFTELEIIEIKA